MPYEVHPEYIATLRKQYRDTFGKPSLLGDWDISELVNQNHSASRIDEADEAALTLTAMVEKEQRIRGSAVNG